MLQCASGAAAPGASRAVRGRPDAVQSYRGVYHPRRAPAYVWISNQIGENGVLTGFEDIRNTFARPFNPNPDRYKPTEVTGAPARSYRGNNRRSVSGMIPIARSTGTVGE